MMRPQLASFAALALLASSRAAWAQGPEAKAPPKLAEAQGEFDAALRALDGSAETDCVTLCRALSSLARATERLCNLTRGEAEATERRCTDARTRLKEATQRVRGACPECALAGQAPPAASVDVGGKPVEEPRTEATKAEPLPAPVDASASSDDSVSGRRGTSITGGLGLLRVALPPTLIKAYGEVAPIDRFSMLVSFGLGRLPLGAGGRATVVAGELQPRYYALGGARGGGLFAGASFSYVLPVSRPAAVAGNDGDRDIDTALSTTGVSIGPVIGGKWVHRSGLTLDLHGGAGVIVADKVGSQAVVPLGDVSVGWTF